MVRLAKPGGWVASQEPDIEHRLCYPPLPPTSRCPNGNGPGATRTPTCRCGTSPRPSRQPAGAGG